MKNLTPPLDDYLRQTFGIPHQTGVHDCLLFIARWVDMVSGSGHHDRLAGTYRTHFEALRKYGRDFNATLTEILTREGWTWIPAADHGVRSAWLPGDLIITDRSGPAIWREKSMVCLAEGITGHLYLHQRHAKGGFRWLK